MKHLIIEANKGYFIRNGLKMEINEITKEDIFMLINKVIEDANFEMDDFDEASLTNPAHKVIYQNLQNHLKEFCAHKETYLEEIRNTYKEAYQKYCEQDTTSGVF